MPVLVPTGDGDSEYRSVAYSSSVHWVELDELKFLAIDILAVLGAAGSLALFGAPNARNDRCHSTEGILPDEAIVRNTGKLNLDTIATE